MPINRIKQPEQLYISPQLRLRRFNEIPQEALEWYQDEELVWLVDGVKNRYTPERLKAMYTYLDNHGELYIIEAFEGDTFIPIGDVTFWEEDMPIVIGNPEYRNRGVGKRVIETLIKRAKELGFVSLSVSEIYDYNAASRRCFENVGFRIKEKTEKGASFIMDLSE